MRLLPSFVFGMGLMLLSGCGGKPVHPPVLPSGIPLQDVCERYHVQWTWDGVTQVVLLEYKGNKAKALVGSTTVLLGKEKIILSSPLRRTNSTIYVPEDFEDKVLAPFGVFIGGMPRADNISSRIHTVVVDAGHGGKDTGAPGRGGVLEKNVVLDIARRLKTLLEGGGINVVMTRDSDEFISLPQRTIIATRAKADLFISIHANSNPSRKTEGIEVYYVKTQTKKDLDEEQRQKNEHDFVDKLNARTDSTTQSIVADMMYHLKAIESSKVAQKLSSRICREVEAPNRGVRPCRFFVVRNTLMPAVLVETGFLTNRKEEGKLNSSGYREKIAEAIARSILDYAND